MRHQLIYFAQLFCLLSISSACFSQSDDGPLVVSQNGHWFEYRDSGKPFFMAGSGGPEGFFYETDARKQTIVDDLVRTGANALYVHSIRSFEGDGYDYEDPFIENQTITSPVDDTVLENWLGYLTQLDDKRIVTWLHIIDDTARPWGCIDNVSDLPQTAKSYVATIVNKFKALDHLVWLAGEEYLMGSCSKAQDDALMSALAAEIRLHDPVHPIGVHHNNGQSMQFGNDQNVNVFAQQICGSSGVRNPTGMHNAASFNSSWVYVMSECHPWHKQLIENKDDPGTQSRKLLRQSNWATAMAGGYVLMYDAYECPNKQCTRNSSGAEILDPDADGDVHVRREDPSEEMLLDMTRLHQFMVASDFHLTIPNDGLATGDAIWVMGNTGIDTYIVYSNTTPETMGVSNLFAGGVYDLRWFDPITGSEVLQQLNGNQAPFSVPDQFGDEVVLSIKLESGGSGNRAPIANNDNYDLLPDDNLSVSAADGVLTNDTDFESNSLTATILATTSNGTLTLSSNGSFTYQPNAGFEGEDSFTYRANDGNANSNAARVIINVNDTPSIALWLINAATNQRVRRFTNNEVINLNSLGFTSFSVEADIDGVGSVAMSYSGFINGSITENVAPYAMFGDTSGNFNGMPVAAGTLTINAQGYSAGSGSGDLVAESEIMVTYSNGVANHAPIGRADTYTVLVNTELTIPANRGVLVNDSDPDSDPLTADLTLNVNSGDLTFETDGSFTYQPQTDFLGTELFRYQAKDSALSSDDVEVSIKVVNVLPLPDDSFCVAIRGQNSKTSVICF